MDDIHSFGALTGKDGNRDLFPWLTVSSKVQEFLGTSEYGVRCVVNSIWLWRMCQTFKMRLREFSES